MRCERLVYWNGHPSRSGKKDSLGVLCGRAARVKNSALQLQYKVTNASASREDFVYGLHANFRIEILAGRRVNVHQHGSAGPLVTLRRLGVDPSLVKSLDCSIILLRCLKFSV